MKNYIFACALLLSLSSCFKERIDVDYNTGENKKVVVTAWITTIDEPQYVDLSYTGNYLGEFTADKISGATITLDDEVDVVNLVEGEAGKYFLPNDWTARVGNNYKLKVNIDGSEYTAEHQMRPCPDLLNVYSDQIPEDYDEFETEVYETFISFQEIQGEGDAYYAIDYEKGTLEGDSLFNGGFADDAFIDGLFFEDIEMTDYDRPHELGDTVYVELHSIGLETSKFLQDIQDELFRGSPFDAPPTNVRTNISGGAIGYFIVGDSRRAELVIQ